MAESILLPTVQDYDVVNLHSYEYPRSRRVRNGKPDKRRLQWNYIKKYVLRLEMQWAWLTYVHKPLPTRDSIRILRLSLADSYDDPLVGSLTAVSLSTRPAYSALSYVWGDPMLVGRMKVNGRVIGIPRNLELALRHIRSSTRDTELWVDAICINQSRLRERNHQVNLMARIYSQAQTVRVWLGCPNDQLLYSQNAFDHAKEIVNEDARGALSEDWTSSLAQLQELTCRKWFHRTWTFQEIALANKAVFQLGHSTIDWKVLRDAFDIIERNIDRDMLEAQAFYPARVAALQSNHLKTFRELFLFTLERRATDPRDKVFALLAHPAAIDGRTNQPIMDADYAKPLDLVYAEATVAMCRASGYLDDLGYADGSPDFGQPWPRWVPKWHRNPQNKGFFLANSSMVPNACGEFRAGDFDLQVQPATSGSTIALHTGAFSLGAIARYSHARAGELLTDSRAEMIWKNFRTLAEVRYGDDTFKALVSCFLCSPIKTPRSTRGLARRNIARQLKKVVNEAMQDSRDARMDQSSVPGKMLATAEIKNTKTTKLFVTSKGFLGVAAASADIGDEVAILPGGRTPLLLKRIRSTDSDSIERWRLAGEGFVAEMMEGQVARMARDGRLDLTTFTIC